MKKLFLVGALSALLTSPGVAFAGNLTLLGDTTGAPTFNRPTETGALSLFENVPYNAYRFTVSQDGLYDFSLAAVDPTVYDTFLHLYLGTFDPAAPDQGFFRANDDANVSDPTVGSALLGVSLSAANTYFLVADGFFNSDFGAYDASVSGPGNITVSAVPEPSSVLLLLVSAVGGALGIAARRRGRRRRVSA